MNIEQIKKAFVGKKLKYNREILMMIDDCVEEDGKIKLTSEEDALIVYLFVEMAEELATHCVYRWRGEYIGHPVCGIMGDQTLRLIEKKGGEQ